jgi:hypothetical protein
MHEHRYISGSWLVICDSCAKKIRSEEAFHRWDGFVVCGNCFEERHPQDFLRARVDKITVPFTRPRGEDVFVEDVGCTIEHQQGIAGIGVAGCAICGHVDMLLVSPVPTGTFNITL